jgi:hypothetical protein
VLRTLPYSATAHCETADFSLQTSTVLLHLRITELLKSRVAIKCGTCHMYFLLPDDKPSAGAAAAAVTAAPAPSPYSSSQMPPSQHKAVKAASSSVPVAAAAAAAAAVGKPESNPSIQWQVLVTAAYASEQLSAAGIEPGLTIPEIIDWIIQYRPEAVATAGMAGAARDTTTLHDPERRKVMNIGVQRVLNKKGEKGEEVMLLGKKVNYWKFNPDSKERRRSDAGSGGEGYGVAV